jgi:hypothetical protein
MPHPHVNSISNMNAAKLISIIEESKITYVRDYIKKLLIDLGFDTYIYHDKNYCDNVYVSLRTPQNYTRIQQLGNVFKFDYDTPVLTQAALDSLKQKQK